MGSAASHAAATPQPPPPPPAYAVPPPPPPPTFDAAAPPKLHEAAGKPAVEEKVDYLNLPCPIPYEEIQRESMMALKFDTFEGLRLDFTRALNQSFGLAHSLSMGSIEIPTQGNDVIKIPNGTYDFGAHYVDPKLLLVGRLSHDGRLNARVKCDLTENLVLKIQAQMVNEPGYSQGVLNFDYKGKDYRSQIQAGSNEFFGANYIQSVTKKLSLGTEAYWLGQQRQSGVGLVGRYDAKNFVATGQIATTGLVSLSYVQKVSDKVSLASDFVYNHASKDVTATFGYDYMLRQCHLRGKFDTNGVVSALLEERLAPFITLSLSAEIDHWKKDYKFGYGLSLGE